MATKRKTSTKRAAKPTPPRPGAKKKIAKRPLQYVSWNALELEDLNPLLQRHFGRAEILD